MRNGNDNRLSNSLETIPEEGNDLPRISELIPKSPETRKREEEYSQLYESHKHNIEAFYEMWIMQRSLNLLKPRRLSMDERYLMGNYVDYSHTVNRSHPTSSPTTMST